MPSGDLFEHLPIYYQITGFIAVGLASLGVWLLGRKKRDDDPVAELKAQLSDERLRRELEVVIGATRAALETRVDKYSTELHGRINELDRRLRHIERREK